MSRFDPANTIGVVVGIERYDISEHVSREDRWDLDGPSADAFRFVEWLRARHVPNENIYMFEAALDQAAHRAALGRLGIAQIFDARQKTLEDFLLNQLPKLAPPEGGQLFLLWGGHGILRAGEERHLYCEDALPNTMRSIWLNDLLRFLRGATSFNRQFIFVDACANAHEETILKSPFYHPLGAGTRPGRSEQYALLAASAGQLAINRRDLHSGLFSTYLFEALQGFEIWPDFPQLQELVLAQFEKRFAEDATFDQRPVALTVFDHTNRGQDHHFGGIPVPRSSQTLAAATGYSVAALQKLAEAGKECLSLATADGRAYYYSAFGFPEPHFRNDDEYDRFNLLGRILIAAQTIATQPADFLNELKRREPDVGAYSDLANALQQASLVRDARAALRVLDIPSSEYRRVFSLMRRGSDQVTLEEMLEALVAQGAIESCAVFDFFFRIADLPACKDPKALRTWVASRAELRHYADLEEKRTRSLVYTAVVSIKPRSGRDERPASLTLWLLENGRTTGRIWNERLAGSDDWAELGADLMRRLEALISEAISCSNGKVFIEILVPIALLRWKFEQLGIKHDRSRFKQMFAREHPMVIRWRDRQQPGFAWTGAWRKSVQHIRQRLAATQAPRWDCLPDQPDEAFMNSLVAPVADFLYLGSPVAPLQEDDPDWLVDVMVAGVPFAGWMAKSGPNSGEVPGLLDQLLQGDFDQLPMRVPEVHRSAQCAPLHEMILLWDDPERRHTFLLEEPT